MTLYEHLPVLLLCFVVRITGGSKSKVRGTVSSRRWKTDRGEENSRHESSLYRMKVENIKSRVSLNKSVFVKTR